jgi:glycosyltransferase involved in cell wall biosynthesis
VTDSTSNLGQAPITAVAIAMVDNERACFGAAIRSVLNQTLRPAEIRVYVAQDNQWISNIVGEETRIVVRRIPMCNAAVARNVGAQEAIQPWIAYLDADDYWLPDRLATQWKVVDRNPDLDFLTGDYWYHDPSGRRFAMSRSLGCPPSGWLVKRSFMIEHPFDNRFTTGQDVEWLLRTTGISNARRVTKPLLSVGIRPDSMKAKPQAKEHKMHRSRLNTMMDLGRTPLRPLVLALTYLRYLAHRRESFWTTTYKMYVDSGHPSAVAKAARLAGKSDPEKDGTKLNE